MSLRHLKVLCQLLLLYEIHVQGKAACVLHAADLFLWLLLLTEGKLDLTEDGLRRLTIEPGNMFGELALLYDCTHTFSVSGTERPHAGVSFIYLFFFSVFTQASPELNYSETPVEFKRNSF